MDLFTSLVLTYFAINIVGSTYEFIRYGKIKFAELKQFYNDHMPDRVLNSRWRMMCSYITSYFIGIVLDAMIWAPKWFISINKERTL